jgi:hypothetical protein
MGTIVDISSARRRKQSTSAADWSRLWTTSVLGGVGLTLFLTATIVATCATLMVCAATAEQLSAPPKKRRWELERKHGQDILRQSGIAVLPAKEFSDYDKAVTYCKDRNCRLVSKPSGTDPDKALSYVAQDAADMTFMLQRWKRLGKIKAPFLLQDFMAGTEMAVGGWFGPGGWNEGWLENWEFKKFANDDLGMSLHAPRNSGDELVNPGSCLIVALRQPLDVGRFLEGVDATRINAIDERIDNGHSCRARLPLGREPCRVPARLAASVIVLAGLLPFRVIPAHEATAFGARGSGICTSFSSPSS